MNIKMALIAVGVGLTLTTSYAHAAPSFALDGGHTGAITVKFNNMESFGVRDPDTGEITTSPIQEGGVNFGVLNVTSIEDLTAGQLWNTGTLGAELTGVFYDIELKHVLGGFPSLSILSTGGMLDLYINPVGSLLAEAPSGGVDGIYSQGLDGYTSGGCTAVGGDCYNGITNVAGGELFLSLAWVPGVLDPALAALVGADANEITVAGGFNFLQNSGSAEGYLVVTGGAYANLFAKGGLETEIGTFADMFARNSFCIPGQGNCGATVAEAGGAPANGGWQFFSNDPVSAFIVPEPGSIALIGLALSAFGFATRRRAT